MRTLFAALATSTFLLLGASSSVAQEPDAQGEQMNGMARDTRSDAEIVASAVRAAPAVISEQAAVATFDGRTVRQGSNGWTCFPDDPAVSGDSPMCLDATWTATAGALMQRADAPPSFSGMGFGYMLQGDFPGSNTDPFATTPSADNEWIVDSGPHVMLLVSDPAMLEGLPEQPGNGPWVMWKGTPYVHLMIPTGKLTD